MALSSVSLRATPDPSPPKAKAALSMTGYPILSAAATASGVLCTARLGASFSSISCWGQGARKVNRYRRSRIYFKYCAHKGIEYWLIY